MEGPDKKRLRVIRRKLEFMAPAALRESYVEVYGAEAGGAIPDERVRESLYEAVDELLDKGS